jgi:acyl-CoA thioesterase-1
MGNACGRSGPGDRALSEGDKTGTILFLGDSLTDGYQLERAEAYPALIEQRIRERGWSFAVVNAGVSGDTSAGGRNRVGSFLKSRVDVLVLELGINDLFDQVPVATIDRNLQAIIDEVQRAWPGARVVVVGLRVPPPWSRAEAAAFKAMYHDLARRNRAALVPSLLKGVAGRRALNLSDGMHPTAEGHQVMANNVWEVLEPILDRHSVEY